MKCITYAVPKDISEILYVMEEGFSSTKNKDWYVTDDREFIERHIETEGYILKYMLDNKIAGFLIVRHPKLAEDNLGRYLPDWSEEALMRVSHMESVAVLPKSRGQKIQKKLLSAAEEIEQKRETKYLMATVHPDNIYSVENLEQLGYQCLLETEKYGGRKRKIMSKELI